MTDPVKTPVVVSASQGIIDTTTAGLRLLAIILSVAPAAALVLRKGDLIAIYTFFHTQQGAAMLAAVTGLASLLFGLYKSYKRGTQVAAVAADPAVPDSVATLK